MSRERSRCPRPSVRIKRHRLGSLAVVLALAAFTAPIWLAGRVYYLQEIGVSDLLQLNVPLRAELHAQLAHGRLPLWTTAIFGGWPAVGELQIGALFPLNWLGPYGDPHRAMSLGIALLMLLAALGTYRLGRTLGLAPAGAAVAAITWPLSGQWVSNVVHSNMQGAIVLAPLAFAYLEEALRRPSRALWLAPVLAFSFFAGYPHMVYLTGLGLALSLALRLLPLWRARPGRAFFGWLGASALVTVLLIGPQLVPALELTTLSQRKGGLSETDAAMGALEPRWLARWLTPWADGDVSRLGTPFPPDGYFIWTHAGWLSCVAAGLALARVRRDPKLVRPLVLLAASVAVACGPHAPTYQLLRSIPGYTLFRFPCRVLFLSELVLALLAGWMVNEGLRARSRAVRGVTAALAAAHLAWMAAFAFPSLPTLPAREAAAPVPTAEWLKRAPPGRFAPVFYHEAWVEAYIRAGGWTGELAPYRYFQAALSHNAAMLHGLASVNGYVALFLAGNERVWNLFERGPVRPDHPPTLLPADLKECLRNAAARYVVSVRPLTDPDLKEVFRTSFPWDGFQVKIYELANPLPRARVDGAAVIVDESPRHLGVAVVANRATTLTVADTWFPGWRAWVDGVETSIGRTDLGHRAVAVPAGRHGVVMAYDPARLRRGTWAGVVGLLAFLLLVAQGRDRVLVRRGARGEQPEEDPDRR